MYKTNTFLLGLRIFAVLLGITGAAGLGWATNALSSPDAGALFEQIGYIREERRVGKSVDQV